MSGMTSTSQLNTPPQSAALVTGAGRGLGLALARGLLAGGWSVVTDARRAGHLATALPGAVVVPGDVPDPAHRDALASAVRQFGRLALLVNNASDLGPSRCARRPTPRLAATRQDVLQVVSCAAGALTSCSSRAPRIQAPSLNIGSTARPSTCCRLGAYGSSKARSTS